MRKEILFIPIFFCLGVVGLFSQNYTTFPYTVETKLQKEAVNIMGPKLNIADTWTNESVLAINALMKEYGEPKENSAKRIIWVLNKPYYKKIVFTEYQSGNITESNPNSLELPNEPANQSTSKFNIPVNGICQVKQPQQIIY